jgi:hypothetical protein
MKTLPYLLLILAFSIFKTGKTQSIHGFRTGVGYGTSFYSLKKMIFITNFKYSPTDLMFKEDKIELAKFLEHTWLIDKALTIGLGVSHNSFTMKTQKASADVSEAKFRQATITFRTQYAWLRKNGFQLYSSVNLGYSFFKQYEIDMFDANGSIIKAHHSRYTDFAMHLNPIGISVGKKIGAFADLGLGFKGIVSAGMYMKL